MGKIKTKDGTFEMLGVGLDVGRRRVRVLKADRDAEGKVRLLGAAIANVPVEGDHSLNLKPLFKGASTHGSAAHCNLGPIRAILHEVEFPPMEGEELGGAIRIEAAQLIPDLSDMVLDYQILPSPGRNNGGAPGQQAEKGDANRKIRVMVLAAPRKAIQERSALFDHAKVDVRSVVPDGVAIANALLALRGGGEAPEMALDVSLGGTNVVAVDRGGEMRAPVVRYVQGGTLLMEDDEPGRERNRLRERWLGEVERTLEFVATRFGKTPENILILGDMAFSPLCLEWLEANLGKPVVIWNPLAEMAQGKRAPERDWIRENGPHFAVAAGLAVTEGK